jgi:hypothetical protein
VRWLALAMVAFLALSGCGGKDGGNKVRLGDGSKVGLDVDKDQRPTDDFHGTISGVVVDDAIYPLPGANVGIPARHIAIVAGEDGRFVIENVTAGLHVIEVSKEGYRTAQATVNVHGGKVAKAVIISARVPIPEPYHRTQKYDTYANAAQGAAFGYQDTRFVASVDDQPVASLVVEAQWDDPVTSMSEDSVLRYSVTPQSDAAVAVSGSSPNPFYHAFDQTFLPPHEFAVAVQVDPDPTVVFSEMTGVIYVTVFYIDPAPPGWSFLEGDT